MTHERLLYLAHLVDRVNTEVNASARITYKQDDCDLYITLLYTLNGDDAEGHAFYEFSGIPSTYDRTHNDKNLIKGEAFMRMLLNSAKAYPPMRAII